MEAPWVGDYYDDYRDAYYGFEDEQDDYYDEDLEFDLAREERMYG